VKLTVIWRFLLSVCELTHIFVCKVNERNKDVENIKRHNTEFSRLRVRILDITCILAWELKITTHSV
jgi:hypothetical protein